MVVYWDLVALINFVFDFTLLLTVSVLLKRNVSKKRLILGSLVGEASMITLFVNMNGIAMNVFKIVLTIAMVICAFSYKDFKYTFYNAVYLYLTGIILGGFEYYLFNEFRVGGQFGVKYLIVLVASPIILIIYYKLSRTLKNNYNNRHSVRIVYEDNEFMGTGYLDSGNKLVSPINGKPIILVEKEYIVHHKLKLVPVPYNALNHHGLLFCFTPTSVEIDGRQVDNVLVGLSEVKFNIDGCNTLLNARMENL